MRRWEVVSGYETLRHGLFGRKGAGSALANVDTLVLDIDGVVVDISDSFRHAVSLAIQFYFGRVRGWPGGATLIQPEETQWFKSAGGFNSDVDLLRAVMIFYLWKSSLLSKPHLDHMRALDPSLFEYARELKEMGGGVPAAHKFLHLRAPEAVAREVLERSEEEIPEIIEIFSEYYAGSECRAVYGFEPTHVSGTEGLFRRERRLLDPTLLDGLPLKLGIVTGRMSGEAGLALGLAGLEDRFDPGNIVVHDGPFRKPDPGALIYLCGRLGSRSGLFVGDTVDDFQMVQNYERLRMSCTAPGGLPLVLFAGVLTGVHGEDALGLFSERGADLIALDVNCLLQSLRKTPF
ncbi:MAG: HAD family hydrolase [Firmicutes bacterium]|nr:HAD family hydrolase [Bacillota bacterium]